MISICNRLTHIPQPDLLAFYRLESLVEFRLERIIGKFRDAFELRRQPVRLTQLLLQPRNNLALNGERGERERIIFYVSKLEIVYICTILQSLNQPFEVT